MNKRLKALIIILIIITVTSFVFNYFTGFLYPYIPFYNYYGVEPPNDSWKNCKGIVTYMTGDQKVTDNKKIFDYWTSRALKESNPKLCKNVGISEGSDVIYPNQHKQAIQHCEYILENNPSFNPCGDIY